MNALPPDDFRRAAIAASLSRREAEQRRGGGSDPVQRRWSSCLPAPEDGRRVLQRGTRILIVSLVLFAAGIGAGGIQAVVLKARYPGMAAMPGTPLNIAGACTLTGFAAGFGGLIWKRRMVASHLRERIGLVLSGHDRPCVVLVEDPATFAKVKLKSEDVGVLVPHPDVGCLRVEGLVCRYIIHAQDVSGITRIFGTNSEAVCVEYAINGTTLKIALQPMSFRSELWRQLFKRKIPLVGVVCRGLGVSERDYGL